MSDRNAFDVVFGMLALAALGLSCTSANEDYEGQFNYGQAAGKGKDWVQAIRVKTPEYRAMVKGTVKVTFTAPGMTAAEARCWHQPDEKHPGAWGYDAVVMEARDIDGKADVSFDFPADKFPHGPTTLRISTFNKETGKRDLCELQLYNLGGVKWNQGIPKQDPPGAKGLKVIFADDFDTMPAISKHGNGATYAAHKPPNGDFSGWRFSHKDDFDGAHDPYEQHGTWLRIKARKWGADGKQQGSGIIASSRFDGSGFFAKPPCYMECRFVAQSAPGTWPAFWTLAVSKDPNMPGCDELDIIEGYGGMGPGNPNARDYHIVSHYWGQKGPDGKNKKADHTTVKMFETGGKSYWSWTAHTYAVYIGEEETIYYFDNIEVLRHKTGPISKSTPAFFLINYAIGGISGWKIDLNRYGNGTDMWVDYVRVFGKHAPAPAITPADGYYMGEPAIFKMESSAPGAKLHYTLDGSEPTAASLVYEKPLSIDKPCTIKVVTAMEGLETSSVTTATVRAPREAVAAPETKPGLTCRLLPGKFMKIPTFDKTEAPQTVPDFRFPPNVPKDHFALLYEGFITVPADGIYTFCCESDDGSQLLIGDHMVIDNDGAHAAIEKKADVGLKAGTHPITVRYFEAWGGEILKVSWSGPGIDKQPIPADKLSHKTP